MCLKLQASVWIGRPQNIKTSIYPQNDLSSQCDAITIPRACVRVQDLTADSTISGESESTQKSPDPAGEEGCAHSSWVPGDNEEQGQQECAPRPLAGKGGRWMETDRSSYHHFGDLIIHRGDTNTQTPASLCPQNSVPGGLKTSACTINPRIVWESTWWGGSHVTSG